MTIAEALADGRQQLVHSPTPDLDARLLLEHVLQVGYSALLTQADKALTPEQAAAYRGLLARAARREPVPYVIGSAPFGQLRLRVTPAVLIPRPETEELVAWALRWARGREGLRVVDVGTGSGCIAISLALALPGAEVLAVDVSAESLSIAQENAQTYHAPITFYQASLLEPIATPVDLIVANLPYVAESEWTRLDDGIKWYEPKVALIAGPDGLDLIRGLLEQAVSRLRPCGAIFLEIGWQQGPAVLTLARHIFPQAICACHRDLAGHERIITIVSNTRGEVDHAIAPGRRA